jgi:hypothetical protein
MGTTLESAECEPPVGFIHVDFPASALGPPRTSFYTRKRMVTTTTSNRPSAAFSLQPSAGAGDDWLVSRAVKRGIDPGDIEN